jgi:cation/acetate symporter
MIRNEPWLRGVFDLSVPPSLWFGIQPISAGVFGVALGFAVMVVVSLVTPNAQPQARAFLDRVRYPNAA